MQIFWFVLSLLVPLLTGIFMASLLGKSGSMPLRSHRRESVDTGHGIGAFHRLTSVATTDFGMTFLRASLAVGFGLGMASVAFILWLLAIGPVGKLYFFVETFLCIGLGVLAYWVRQKEGFNFQHSTLNAQPFRTLADPPRWTTLSKPFRIFILSALVVAVISALCSFVVWTLFSPHGGWDTWSIWNLRSRFLFRGGIHWNDLFALDLGTWTHLDYPLLVPGIVARCWFFMGGETQWIPVTVSLLFTLGTFALLVSGLSVLHSKTHGCFAGLLFICTPLILRHCASQQADIPVGFYFLATLVLLTLAVQCPDASGGLCFLAGLTAGLAAWTKNEGVLFFACVLFSRLVVFLRSADKRVGRKQLIAFATGALPVIALVLYFKSLVPLPNDLLGQLSTYEKFTSASRYLTILGSFVHQGLDFGGLLVKPGLLLGVYLLLVGIDVPHNERLHVIGMIAILLLMSTGFFFAFLLSPHDLDWHLKTALSRIAMQMWPSVLFVFFYIARAPEAILAEIRHKSE